MGEIIAVWFSYVGGCLSSSDPTCRPFLGFISLLSAAGGALVLLWIAYAGMCVHLTREARRTQEDRAQDAPAPGWRSTVEERQQPAAANTANPPSTGWMAGA